MLCTSFFVFYLKLILRLLFCIPFFDIQSVQISEIDEIDSDVYQQQNLHNKAQFCLDLIVKLIEFVCIVLVHGKGLNKDNHEVEYAHQEHVIDHFKDHLILVFEWPVMKIYHHICKVKHDEALNLDSSVTLV